MADIIIDGTTVGANRFLLLDSTGKIPAVDGSQVITIAAGNITTGTIPIACIDVGTTANKIVQLDGNAKLPALDGSQLTNVPGATKNASDPTISTNPSGGIGSEWHNTTSGEAYICTDATAGANIWKNIGAGSGNVQPFYYLKCDTYGFCGMGYGESPTGNWPRIDRIAFASDALSDQGDTTQSRRGNASSSSTTHSYAVGGFVGPYSDTIDKYAMSSPANSTDVGNLGRAAEKGGSHTSDGYGYKSGTGAPGAVTYWYRWSHSTDGNSIDWASLSIAKNVSMGGSTSTHGYCLGSNTGTADAKEGIEKIAWASGGTASDIGNLNNGEAPAAAQSTTDYIYATGTSAQSTNIQKISTASDGNAVARGGALYLARGNQGGGTSSLTYGYTMGGSHPSIYSNIVDKFAFASTADSTDVGDLTDARGEQPCQGQF